MPNRSHNGQGSVPSTAATPNPTPPADRGAARQPARPVLVWLVKTVVKVDITLAFPAWNLALALAGTILLALLITPRADQTRCPPSAQRRAALRVGDAHARMGASMPTSEWQSARQMHLLVHRRSLREHAAAVSAGRVRHAEHWRPRVESGQMVILGPVLDASGSWGLGVVEADDEQQLRAFAADDPVVTAGTGTIEVGQMLGGVVRPRPAR